METMILDRKKMSLIVTAVLATLLLLSLSRNAQAQKIKTTPFGKGINFAAADSSMSMKMNVRMQNLLEVIHLPEEPASVDQTSLNFLVRRYRLKFAGFVYDPRLRYKMELGISNRDQGNKDNREFNNESSNIVLDAVVKYKFANGHLDFWLGQTKLPGNRERVVSSADLQFVDRSLVNSYFNIDRDRGVQLHGKWNVGNMIVRPKVAISTGEGRNLTAVNAGGLDYTARLELLPFGAFEGKKQDYIEAAIVRQSTPKLMIGMTYDYNDRAVRQGGQLKSFVEDANGDLVQNSLSTVFIDFVLKYGGWSLSGEYANKQGDKENDANWTKGYRTGSGYVVQTGYVFKSNWEVAGRYTSVEAADDFSGVVNTTEYTVGLSKYLVGHKLKIQTDFSYLDFADIANDSFRGRLQVEVQL